MERLETTGDIIRKVALFTILGFLAIFLIGPVLTVLGVILPFAVIGFLIWLPFRLLVQRKEINWTGVPEQAGRVVRSILLLPFRLGGFVLRMIVGVLRLVGGVIGLVLRILLPAVAGAIFFAILGAIGGINHQDVEFRLPIAILIGAGIGALYGAFRSRPTPQVIVLRPAPAPAHQN